MAQRRLVELTHGDSGRRVPVEVPTVFGRSDHYYRYTDLDERPNRLRADVVDGLAALNYIKLCSDEQVSRTHGLLDPRIPGVCDLNSTNGTMLNKRRLPGRAGDTGPTVSLADGDEIRVGRQRFQVALREASEEEVRARAQRQRVGFVGSDHERRPRAAEVKAFLTERKGFTVHDAVGWQAVIANCYRLQSAAHPEGLAVVAIFARARGGELFLGDEAMTFAKLLPLLIAVPGRKVLALELAGDPSQCERYFEAEAYEDMALLTSPGELQLGSERMAGTLQSRLIDRVKDSVDGDPALRNAFDDVVDGLDALIGADTNILDVSWVSSYQGRIKVTFGQRMHSDECALSHSLRLGSSTFRF